MVDNRQSFVMYESVYKHINRLNKQLGAEAALNFFNTVCEYGLYGVVPEDDDVNWLYGLEQTFTSIGMAKDRYTASVENGKKGGRPQKQLDKETVMALKQELKTWNAVAERLGIHPDTLRKIRNQWDATPAEEPEKPKNPNDNVNDNVNINENKKMPSISFGKGVPSELDYTVLAKKYDLTVDEVKAEYRRQK